MSFRAKRVLLTGATGGIGRFIALKLADQGAILALTGSNLETLQALCDEVGLLGAAAYPIAVDFKQASAAAQIVTAAQQYLGNIDIVINNAAILDFVLFEEQDPQRIADMIKINVTTPIQLSRLLLPLMLKQGAGQIVNVGSTFGSLGFPYYASYCASKFAMRGFSQALRRELAGNPAAHDIYVTYVAPRAVNTELNNDITQRMLRDAKIHMDEPEDVTTQIVQAIAQKKSELFIGQPESFFAWLNGFFPSLVNLGLKSKAKFARTYAARQSK